jgi:hypothetical protein
MTATDRSLCSGSSTVFLFAIRSLPVLGPTQLPIQNVNGKRGKVFPVLN